MDMNLAADFLVRYPNGDSLSTPELHDQGEQLMKALLDLENTNAEMHAPATASDGIEGSITIELVIEADSFAHAVSIADPIMRTAIHTIGGATPQWGEPGDPETCFKQRGVQVEYV